MTKVTCACSFVGVLDELLIDDESHRQFYCPKCLLAAGIEFIQPIQKQEADL